MMKVGWETQSLVWVSQHRAEAESDWSCAEASETTIMFKTGEITLKKSKGEGER
jgi:hypothetical protein